MKPLRSWALVVLTLALAGTAAHAQARDPTQPPPEALPRDTTAPAQATVLSGEGIAVVNRDDKPHLVVGTRLYGVGKVVDGYKIERITETQIWLRKGKELRKVPRFSGIERKVSNPKALTP
jgi:hypothetical protein